MRQVLDEGAIAGYPMQDVRVSVYDGKFHPVDSKDIAFATAGRKAFIEAVDKAKAGDPGAHRQDPHRRPELTAMGDLAGDLSGRRGRINGSEAKSHGPHRHRRRGPAGGAGRLRRRACKALTGGEGTYSIELSHYEAVPGNIQKRLMDAFKRAED